jgi:hypothetical protein
MRTTDQCSKCGEVRELATVNPPRCFKCYRQDEREKTKDLWQPDANLNDVAKELRKNRKALMKMMDALDDLTLIPEATVCEWRRLLRPEVEKIALSLGDRKPQVNGEQANTSEPVHSQDKPF